MPMKKLKPSPSPSRMGGNRTVLVEIACIPNQGEAANFLKQLVKVIARKPSRIVLRFLAGSVMNPDTALSAYELLQDAKCIQIDAEAVSSIFGPALILFLLAERRTMRRTGFLFFPPEGARHRNRARDLLRDVEAWKEDPEDEETDARDWVGEIRRIQIASIQSIVQRHILWSDVTGKPLGFEAASDYGLLGGTPLTKYLDHLEAEMLPDSQAPTSVPPRSQARPE